MKNNRFTQSIALMRNLGLLTNGKQNILIDTSAASKWNKLDKRLSELKINKIDYLILTQIERFEKAKRSIDKEIVSNSLLCEFTQLVNCNNFYIGVIPK